jgi:UDP-N-acetylmuramoyl-tripeptide--D-alanyl-D-alanine ligase
MLLDHLPQYTFRSISSDNLARCKIGTDNGSFFTLSQIKSLILQGTTTSASELIKDIADQNDIIVPSIALRADQTDQRPVYLCYQPNFEKALELCRTAISNDVRLIVGVNRRVLELLAKENNSCGLIYCYNTANKNLSAIDRAIRPLVKAHRRKFDLPCVAISGTAGKTTTTDLVRSILEVGNNVFSTYKSQNNIKRTTRHLLNLNDSHSCALFEFGTNGHGQIKVLSALTQPNITYTTSIGIDHLERIPSLDEMLECETEQYDWMDQNCQTQPVFIINIDDPYILKFYQNNYEKLRSDCLFVTVSSNIGKNADYQILSSHEYFNGQRFATKIEVSTPYGIVKADVPLIGSHNHANICGAIAASLSTGVVTIEDVETGLGNPTFTGKRAEFHTSENGISLFDETFHSSPHGLKKSLQMLVGAQKIAQERFNQSCAILGDMGELGDQSAKFHIEMGQFAKQIGINRLYAFGQYAKYFGKGFGEDNCLTFKDKEEVWEYLSNKELSTTVAQQTLYLLKGGYQLKTHTLVKQILEFEKISEV